MFCKFTKLIYIYKMKQVSDIEKQQIFTGLALFDQLAERCIKLSEMDVSYLDYQNWMRHGLLIQEQALEKNTQRKLTYFEYLWIRIVDDMNRYGIRYEVIRNIKKELVDKTLEKDLLAEIHKQVDKIKQVEPDAAQFIKDEEKQQTNKSKILEILSHISSPLHLILLYAVAYKKQGALIINHSGNLHVEFDDMDDNESELKCSPHLCIPLSYMTTNYLKIDDLDCCTQINKPLNEKENKLIKIIRGRKFGELESISIGYKNGEMDLIKVRELKRTVIESRLIDHIQKGGYHNIEYKVQGGSLVHFVNERVIKV